MKIIQYMNRLVPIYMDCIKKGVIARLPSGVDYTLLQGDPYNCICRNKDPRSPSEELRLRLAIDNPDMVWMDTDTAIRYWPSFEKKDKPYFIQGVGRPVEECLFYVNGCVEFFKELLEEYLKDPTITDNIWLAKAVAHREKEVYVIPSDAFIHCRFSLLSIIEPNCEIPGTGYLIKNNNGVPSLFLDP